VGCGFKELAAMQTTWQFYYWSDCEIMPVNDEGETLKTCMDRYGVGGWYSREKGMIAVFVFVSADKTAENSWLLGIKQFNGNQALIQLYEMNPHAFHLSLDTPLGVRITNLLAACEMEDKGWEFQVAVPSYHPITVQELASMQTKWQFYYWSETMVNHEGETLKTCMDRYGVGGWYSREKDMVTALVFLSAEKTAAMSWGLGVKQFNGKQALFRMQEEARYPHLSPDTPLGVQITSLLAACKFEDATS
jgi:hypothetical protein